MSRVRALVRWLWWATVGALPVVVWAITRMQEVFLHCPPRGDCYVRGAEALIYWDTLTLGMAALLWPACAWFLFVAPWRRRESK